MAKKMTGRRTTMVRELADVCAARYREQERAAMSTAEIATSAGLLLELQGLMADAFGDRCAWCGLPQEKPQKDHFPPLVQQRMWTGYTWDVCVPSCAKDNRQYTDWEAHIVAQWRSDDLSLLEGHRIALRRVLELQDPVPRHVYEDAFKELRDHFDTVLAQADAEIARQAELWVAATPATRPLAGGRPEG
jgi:hypothetical protein